MTWLWIKTIINYYNMYVIVSVNDWVKDHDSLGFSAYYNKEMKKVLIGMMTAELNVDKCK